MFFRSVILKTGLSLLRNILPISVAFCAFQLPSILFGTLPTESPMWEMIKHRHAETDVAPQFEIERIGEVSHPERATGLWASGQRSIRTFVRGLSINPRATLENTLWSGRELLEETASAIRDSAWGDSVRSVASSFKPPSSRR